MAPARAGPADSTAQTPQPTLVSVANSTLTKVVPQLLDPQGAPTLAQPQVENPVQNPLATPETVEPQAPAAEAVPSVKPSGNLAALVAQLRGSNSGSRELECLATGIYYESKSEPLAGQLAVGKVIANRANSGGRFPGTYCGVLFQRGQFSFIRGHSLPSAPRASRQWQTAVAIAKVIDGKLHESQVANALFFHARYVSPGWRMKRLAAIGNHIFYR